MGQIKFVGALIMTALFSLALITVTTQFADENDASFSVDEDFTTKKDNIDGHLTVWHSDSNKSSKSFTESEIQTQETFKTGGQFKGGAVSSVGTVKEVLKLSFNEIFGEDSDFSPIFTALISFLTIVSMMYIYKTWVGRNPD